MARRPSIEKLRAEARKARSGNGRPRVLIGAATCGRAAGALDVAAAFNEEIERRGLDVEVVVTGCQGWCGNEPLVLIEPHRLFYQRVTPYDVAPILDLTLSRDRAIDRLLYSEPDTGDVVRWWEDVPFYGKQRRIILRNCGMIDPTDIHSVLAAGGYEALEKVIAGLAPDEVIEEIKRSGLRGRGGAGFPTGRKWELCRRQQNAPKYVICNGDEGDPGAFMDRSVLEGDPHSVIEGMIIAAYAIGDVHEGTVYVRAEYPLAVRNLTIAIEQAEELGLLGKNILGSGLDFHLGIKRGAGAFVCGESTALMYSIEGVRGMPRQTPPRSVERGLWGKPTVLNNVKTFALVPVIINRGADWFAAIGTEGSKGTQVFALTGKVKNTGLVEVPMGITIRELVHDIGGGTLGGGRCKAVQTGGPSGGCIPESLFDTPIDFDSLQEIGAMMGSGGLVVMDESDCMVSIARYFLAFTQQESCGKCTPCRVGTYRMLEIMDRIVEGKGEPGDIERLENLGREIQETALCALGRSAPNPVLTTIRHFRDEYEAHIRDRRCPVGVCHSPGGYRIVADECLHCGLCLDVCDDDAIRENRSGYTIDREACIGCGKCHIICPAEAIVLEETEEVIA
ncbi:MAG: NADH-quinone oxidoreductase subunit NuoF [Candidatus Bipolaricaulota bacterium]|nr:MAG: NADH-quinone oxidoreductase subunit NuoF [Candidatus Bipolaricaulota bacterium]